MKRQLVKRPQVLRDIAMHFHYIGWDSERAALRFLDETEHAFELIATFPGIGTAWESGDPRFRDVRSVPVSRRFRNYIVFFRSVGETVEILAVIHGRRDLAAALDTLSLDS